ncbi:hypothetical protein ACFQI7_34750 [Paenibacillus allorhizosphaerae]|uniref:Secreted protein n=1 Tax=Paenibacillus allorhizosphaerae TaxID=2849866 RepID=A0ABM8VSV1_9BACL|nr:hypothetical protein [Paenibacillus allorhizosphaerae]CAG7657029.1 hypothetical protein PAECIP111802_06591 [Paenibacillus allorhizosphaerae]
MNSKMMKIAIPLLLSAALLSACGKSDTKTNSGAEHGGHGAHEAGEQQVGAGANQEKDVQAVFKLSSEKPRAKQDTGVSIQIAGKDNKPIESLDVSHEKKLHLIVVSKDLSYFNHIHPEDKGKGAFQISTQFPAGGEYKLFADFVPTGMGSMTKSQWITVQGDAAKAVALEPEANLTKTVDGKEVTLTFDKLQAGKAVNMTFNIKDAASKKPITNLQPYLGAVGHVVVLSADASQYLHVHPTDEKAAGPDAKFMTTFPASGIYKIWGQFQHEGKVFTVPFVVKVP